MDGWLKEDFEMDQAVTGRIVAGVRQRVAHRRRTQAALTSTLGLCFVGIMVGSFMMDGRRPTDVGSAVASNVERRTSNATIKPYVSSTSAIQPGGPAAERTSALDLSLSRVDHSVAVTWEGDPGAEYVVYRCSSPKFDTCSLADRVKGTQWVDPAQDSGTITFYRVEPKG